MSKLSAKDARLIWGMIPAASLVAAREEGILIEAVLENGDEAVICQTMCAALEMKLDPTQIVDQCEHHEAYCYSTLTQGGGHTTFSVMFLYDPQP